MKILEKETNDTTRLKIFQELTEVCEPEDVEKYAVQGNTIANRLLSDKKYKSLFSLIKKRKAECLNNLAYILTQSGKPNEGLNHYFEILKIYEELGLTKNIIGVKTNLGYIFLNLGDIPRAIDYFEQAIKLGKPSAMNEQISQALNNLGYIYKQQGDLDKALDYYKQAFAFCLNKKTDHIAAVALSNIGSVHRDRKEKDSALFYYEKSYKIDQANNIYNGMATTLGNIAGLYNKPHEAEKVLEMFKQVLTLFNKAGDAEGIVHAYNNIASNYYKLKKINLAFSYSDSALSYGKKLGYPYLLLRAEKLRSALDSAQGDFKSSFLHYKQYIIFRDSVSNENTRKASIKSQLKYEFEKKEVIMLEQQDKERVLAEEKSRFQLIVIGSIALGLILVLIFAVFIFRTLKTTRRQKVIIEEKQIEILDSIHYAKRIQKALITNEKYIEKSLNKLQKNS